MADRVGQQLGNYRLIRLLGQGGFAEVYLAEHIYLKTQAAIKILQTRLEQENLQDFLNEAQTIARLRHPHIVQVLDFGVDGGTPYLVMDFAPNGTLRARHPRGTRLASAIVLPYIRQVAEGLQFAHDQRLIHRDIKPENMLLGRSGEVLLSDFGIATVAQTTGYQRTQGFAGTAAYSAPEQLQGKPVQASDQYSLAVVMYEWLTGDTPFHGSSLEIATQHVLVAPPPLRARAPAVPPLVEQVVMTGLAKAPRDRFGSVRAFVAAFEQAMLAGPGWMGDATPPFVPPPTVQAPVEQIGPPGGSIYVAPTQVTPPTPAPVPPIPTPLPPNIQQAGGAISDAPTRLTPPAPALSTPTPAPSIPTPVPPNAQQAAYPTPTPVPPGNPPGAYPVLPGAYPVLPVSGGQMPPQAGPAQGVVMPPPPPQKHLGRNLLLALLAVVVVAGGVFGLWLAKGGSTAHSPGSGVTATTPDLAANQVLRVANIGVQDIQTLDPALVEDSGSYYAVELLFTGLVNLDPNTLKVVPDLATGWDLSADGKTYTFHLRSGLKFSNGDPLTAQDVAYSIDRAFDPAQSGKSYTADYYLGGQGGVIAGIVGAQDREAGRIPTMIGPGRGLVVVDATTLQINLTRPALWFLDALTYAVSWVVDKKIIDQYGANWFDGHAVGSGPFIVKSWQHKVQLTFVPNPSWYGAKSHLTEIDMPLISDSNLAWSAFQAGQIDVDNALPSADYAAAKALGSKEFAESPNLSTFYLAPNSKVPPFDNVTVRQAFAEAVDRETIANQILGGTVLPTDHMVPQGQPGYYAGLKGLPFNPADAAARLRSVYPNVGSMPPVTLEYPTGGRDAIVAKLQQDFQTYLGVTISLKAVTFGQLVTDIETKNAQGIYPVQFYILGWVADYPDPQDWLDQVTSTNINNNMNFSSAQVDSLVAQADASTDENQRISLYNQAEELAIDQVAWIPYSQGKNIVVFQSNVHGYVLDAQGLIPPSVWANVYICRDVC
jgi:oligopeptide transport system substrate-binding protein